MSHKEYITDIVSSSTANTFDIQQFSIQPGDSNTFPWLAQIAANFQEYRFHGVVFHFRSMSADALNSTNTALGQVIMSTEYNAASPPFASKPEMENAQYSNSIKPSESCLHLIECARSASVLTNLYVRTDDLPSSSQDIRFYDLGNFFIATNGCQGTSVNLGELWVTYEVELLKPKIWSDLGETNDYYNSYTVTGITNTLPFGTSEFVVSDNSNLNVVIDPAARTITLPPSSVPKTYFLILRWKGARTGSLNPPGSTYVNCAVSAEPFPNNATPVFISTATSPDDGATSLSFWLMDIISVATTGNGMTPIITFDTAGILPASSTIFNFIVTQVPNTISFIPE